MITTPKKPVAAPFDLNGGLLADSIAEWEALGRPGAVLPPARHKPPRPAYDLKLAAIARDEYLDRNARTMIANIPSELIRRARGHELRDYCESHGLPRFSVETRKHAAFLLREAERAAEAAA